MEIQALFGLLVYCYFLFLLFSLCFLYCHILMSNSSPFATLLKNNLTQGLFLDSKKNYILTLYRTRFNTLYGVHFLKNIRSLVHKRRRLDVPLTLYVLVFFSWIEIWSPDLESTFNLERKEGINELNCC